MNWRKTHRWGLSFGGVGTQKVSLPLRCSGLMLCGLMSALVSACSGGIEVGDARGSCQLREPSSTDNLRVVVSSFWMENSQERAALDILIERARDVGLSASPEARIGRTDIQLTLAENLQKQKDSNGASSLPDVVQVNGGSDVLQYIERDSLPELCSLGDLEQRYGFQRKIFDAAWQPSACDGGIYALPLSIHRLNLLHFNVAVDEAARVLAREHGVELPPWETVTNAETLLEMIAQFDSLELQTEAGQPILPLAIGIGKTEDHSWALQHLAFENLLMSYGRAMYESQWQGGARFSDEDVRQLVLRLSSDLATVGALCSAMTDMDWDEAILSVAEGRAWMTIGGDWLLAQPPDDLRDNVVTLPFPGTEDTFVYTPDSFAVPRLQESDGASAHQWFRDVVSDRRTQIEFARAKQAIPSLKGLTEEELSQLESPYLEQSYRRFSTCSEGKTSCRAMLAVSGLAPPPGHNPCFDRIGLILAVIAGGPLELEARDGSQCDRPFPNNKDEAEAELAKVLLDLSQRGFAPRCRESEQL